MILFKVDFNVDYTLTVVGLDYTVQLPCRTDNAKELAIYTQQILRHGGRGIRVVSVFTVINSDLIIEEINFF